MWPSTLDFAADGGITKNGQGLLITKLQLLQLINPIRTKTNVGTCFYSQRGAAPGGAASRRRLANDELRPVNLSFPTPTLTIDSLSPELFIV
jgi:hypothetical protein